MSIALAIDTTGAFVRIVLLSLLRAALSVIGRVVSRILLLLLGWFWKTAIVVGICVIACWRRREVCASRILRLLVHIVTAGVLLQITTWWRRTVGSLRVALATVVGIRVRLFLLSTYSIHD